MAERRGRGFAGNKSFLPTKECVVCHRPMMWRKSWEKNWDSIKYCSEACRQQAKKAREGTP